MGDKRKSGLVCEWYDMKTRILLTYVLCLMTSSCSLVTVPVKTAGGIVKTTVSTTGKVVTAPFDAVGRSKASKKEKEAAKRAAEEEQISQTTTVSQ